MALAGAALLSACSMAPPYAPPQAPAAAAYKSAAGWEPASAATPVQVAWWTAFNDPVLDELEGRIGRDDPTLGAAAARYEQASAALARSRSALLPQVGLGADATRRRLSAGRPQASSAARTDDVTAGASLAYELDLFGRLRSGAEASRALAQASEADLAAVQLGLQAQLASVYFDLRGLDARIALLRETIDAYQRAFDLTNTRHEGGMASGVDVSRARAQLANARSELEASVAARARDENAIAILVGENPSAFALAAQVREISTPSFAAGVPSTLLQRRPDVIVAERRVAAANAQIGVARAAFFPSITLGATGGYEASGGRFLQADNRFWALGPLSADLPLFDGGARRANLRISRAEYDEAVDDYRQTVLTAFQEVEDDLATARHLEAQAQSQLEAMRAAEQTRDLALTRYRDGASDYLDVVTAQTAALDAERAWLQLRSQQLKTATDLVRALGGAAPSTR